MEENQVNYIDQNSKNGSVSYANDVIAIIAGIATVEIEGVARHERRHHKRHCGNAWQKEFD